MNRLELEEREQEALNSLDDAKERIKQLEEDLAFWRKECASAIGHMEQLEEDVRFWKGEYEAGVGRVQIVECDLAYAQRDLADMTKLAVDYKESNTRLEDELREFHAKDGGRTREHNLLVQENRKLQECVKFLVEIEPKAEIMRRANDSLSPQIVQALNEAYDTFRTAALLERRSGRNR